MFALVGEAAEAKTKDFAWLGGTSVSPLALPKTKGDAVATTSFPGVEPLALAAVAKGFEEHGLSALVALVVPQTKRDDVFSGVSVSLAGEANTKGLP